MEMTFKSNNGIQSLEVAFCLALTHDLISKPAFKVSAWVAIDGRETTFLCSGFRLEVQCYAYNRGNSSTTVDLLTLIEILSESRLLYVSCSGL